MTRHFIMRARLIGEDKASADCICGWGFVGTIKETNKAGEKHMNKAMAEDDRTLYGTSYEIKRPDGTLERIDPTTIIIKK